MYPPCERTAVASRRVGVFPTPSVYGISEIRTVQQGIGYGDRTNRVVGKVAVRREQLKVCLVRVIELES